MNLPPVDKEKLSKKAKRLLRLAVKGDAKAIRDIGCDHIHAEEGFSPSYDPVRARNWYEIAANLGDPEAQYDLGTMFLDGEGGNVDVTKAIQLLSSSALNTTGDPISEYAANFLAEIFREGLFGTKQDPIQAAKWLKVSKCRPLR